MRNIKSTLNHKQLMTRNTLNGLCRHIKVLLTGHLQDGMQGAAKGNVLPAWIQILMGRWKLPAWIPREVFVVKVIPYM